ncbi:hypothetical protein CPB83DRAFT_852251 [Crepidotus variabilis]|uniref:Uncharacterized protein n=1 Tax=Crepidotus variabilis TaxID=179855 RepID=A0A9P6EI30_9AGAR|nr:hypothetical protein CPB83DRAFT_852251 [Crepidotus variabilis]
MNIKTSYIGATQVFTPKSPGHSGVSPEHYDDTERLELASRRSRRRYVQYNRRKVTREPRISYRLWC